MNWRVPVLFLNVYFTKCYIQVHVSSWGVATARKIVEIHAMTDLKAY